MITEVGILGKTETVGIVLVRIAPVGIALVGIGTCTQVRLAVYCLVFITPIWHDTQADIVGRQ